MTRGRLPAFGQWDPQATWHFYLGISDEIESGHLDSGEREHMARYYAEAGLLRAYRRPYFRQHFCATFVRAGRFLLDGAPQPHILDLGCGCGTQSLLLALAGARVTALDRDPLALRILEKRKRYYEELVGRSLDSRLHAADALTFPYVDLAPLTGVYSMFALNMMQPTSSLMSALTPGLAPGARLAVLDGNNQAWLPRLYPPRRRRVWSPTEFRRELEAIGFRIHEHVGGVALPPFFWVSGDWRPVRALDAQLCKNWLFPISHQILAELQRPVPNQAE